MIMAGMKQFEAEVWPYYSKVKFGLRSLVVMSSVKVLIGKSGHNVRS